MRFNPFRPNHIVHPAMFVGRGDELIQLEKALFQTKNGNAAHFLIDGERGIGKSSLLLYLKYLSEGQVLSGEGTRFNFVTLSLTLDPSYTQADIICAIAAELERELRPREQVRDFLKGAWKILSSFEVGGLKYSAPERARVKDSALLEELCYVISESLERLGNSVDGLLLFLDEADKPPVSSQLGIICKLLPERLKVRHCDRVCIGLAGLPNLRDRLKKSHESSIRMFNILTLGPLSTKDRASVVERGLAEATEKNGFEVSIGTDALSAIGYLSEGYPHFIQQFAYSAFEADKDNRIDVSDVMDGAYEANGAFRQLGLKYFEKQYFEQIGSDEYREVLRALADHMDNWVTKAELRKKAGIKESTLNNALTALKQRGIISAKPGRAGVYRLPSRSFAVWIRAFTNAREVETVINAVGMPIET